jgi:phosphatidylserine/phosphatidylglycerophosphate/cardiolipin synthase-like enzyme
MAARKDGEIGQGFGKVPLLVLSFHFVNVMDELLATLRASIEDEFFSKPEKRGFKALLTERARTEHELQILRNEIYTLAAQRATPQNYSFVIEWMKTALQALAQPQPSDSAVFFSPGESCRHAIVQQIDQAVRELRVCVFTISDDQITRQLLLAHRKGVSVQIITDNDKSLDEGSDIEQLARAGIAVRMDTTPNHMHHKFMVADQKTLITGSYNWTLSAARFNHENVLLTREAATVKNFLQHFGKLWPTMSQYR